MLCGLVACLLLLGLELVADFLICCCLVLLVYVVAIALLTGGTLLFCCVWFDDCLWF